jgi:hypothetical protein
MVSQKAIEINIELVASEAIFALFNTTMLNMLNGIPIEQSKKESHPCMSL